MGILVETHGKVLIGGQAWLVEENRELAWAEKHVVKNPALAWILGKYVEADNFNENGQYFDLAELETAQTTLHNGPLNMVHRHQYIVGAFKASELLYPIDDETAGLDGEKIQQHPYVESLAAFWKYYFPDEYKVVETAHARGSLWYSMETVPRTVACRGGCDGEFDYDGVTSSSYCAHLNQSRAKKVLHQPHFTGGALILPPVKPGWKKADITELSSLLIKHAAHAEMAYEEIRSTAPHLEAKEWEQVMLMFLQTAEKV